MVRSIRDPKVSVIIAVLNGAKNLQRCIDSVSEQLYSNKELIVIDGDSKDGTLDIVKENENKISYWESKPDRGIYHAWNKALGHAKGDWLYFLGTDDYLWRSDVLNRVVPILSIAYPRSRVVYGSINLVYEDGKLIMSVGKSWSKKVFLQLMSIPHQGIFHHRSLFEDHGHFDESFRIAGDYEMLLREFKTKDAVYIPDLIIAGMQYGGISSNSSNAILILKEISKARQKNGIKIIPHLWYWTYMKAYSRRMLSKYFGEKRSLHITNFYRTHTGRSTLKY